MFASLSTDGGVTWAVNQNISTAKYRISCPSCGGGGTPAYQGDYNSIGSAGTISVLGWTDFRQGNFGSYLAYFPDFAMKVGPATDTLNSFGDTAYFWVSVPSVKLYTDVAKFTDTVPAPVSGTITLTLMNKTANVPQDSLTTFPDSLRIRVVTSGGVTTGLYTVTVTGKGPRGVPIHKRTFTFYADPTIGISNINSEIPREFYLYQNFPNPFNPKTNIRFDIAKSGLVKLKVFDITGREVAQLLNKEYNAGKYIFDFDASNYASGVYFYKLETPGFVSIKKMILIK
jgi:hypothetical protein